MIRPRQIIALVLSAIAPLAIAQPDIDRATLANQISEFLQPAVEADLFSGIILVAWGGEILYHEPFGYADWELRTPITRESRLGVGSITKPMTSTLVKLLVTEGRLDLDMPVEQFINGFPRGPEGGVPTVGHLLMHRAGVPHRVTTEAEESQPLGTTDIVERVKQQRLLFEPGSDRLYSSAGYTILSRVIEVIEGKPYEEVLSQRIFEPAGMADATSETGLAIMPRRASPYILGTTDGRLAVLNAPYKDLRFLTGAGSMYASAEDLFRFLRAAHDEVFGPEFWDESFDADATTWRGIAGRTSGYEAYVDVLPTEDFALIIVTNLRSMATWQTWEAVRAMLIGEPVDPLRLPPPPVAPFEPLADAVGIYDRNGSPVEIRLEEGRLFRGDNEIYPIADERYFTPASGSAVAFRRNDQGEVDALLSPPDDETSAMPRIE